MMDTRAYASPKGLRPRRRVKPAYDAYIDTFLGNHWPAFGLVKGLPTRKRGVR
jgi:hypothetical protein